MRAKQVSKQGKHGKLFLYRVTYTDHGEHGEVKLYAYNCEHLMERFYEEPGWEETEFVSAWPVYERQE